MPYHFISNTEISSEEDKIRAASVFETQSRLHASGAVEKWGVKHYYRVWDLEKSCQVWVGYTRCSKLM